MDKPKILSGNAIVALGVLRQSIDVPEVGLKNVAPDGSWLQQKQTQKALESRKEIIGVERIMKIGSVSHATWQDDLQLAEVTQKVGCCWQYFGHNVGKTLYLRPEEVLFLMEMNSLVLKHNDVNVSLQKAYSLILNTHISYIKYSVYASLSRLGYKVNRHKVPEIRKNIIHPSRLNQKKPSENLDKNKEQVSVANVSEQPQPGTSGLLGIKTDEPKEKSNLILSSNEENKVTGESNIKEEPVDKTENFMEVEETVVDKSNVNESIPPVRSTDNETSNILPQNNPSDNIKADPCEREETNTGQSNSQHQEMLPNEKQSESIQNTVTPDIKNEKESQSEDVTSQNESIAMEINDMRSQVADNSSKPKDIQVTSENIDTSSNDKDCVCVSDALINNRNQMFHTYVTKIKKLTGRQQKPTNFDTLKESFGGLLNLYGKKSFTMNIPKQEFVPPNIFREKKGYVLRIKHISNKCNTQRVSSHAGSYHYMDEVNGSHVGRLRNVQRYNRARASLHDRVSTRPNFCFRPYNIWRPHHNLNYVQFNMFFQRPSFSNVYFQSRLQYQPRPNPLLRTFAYHNPHIIPPINPAENIRKRQRFEKIHHLQNIRNLAARLKGLFMNGNEVNENIQSIERLLRIYNTTYNGRLRLTKELDITNDEIIVETIDLADEGETRTKRPKLRHDSDKFDENINLLRQLASKLKALEAEDQSSSKHKRALSKAIKIFNKSYDADIYMNSKFEIIDRKFITIDSDSDDCVVTEPQNVYKGKKLRNPFNILKRRSEQQQQGEPRASTSKDLTVTANYCDEMDNEKDNSYSSNLVNNFKSWLPPENDFGRAEVVHKNVIDSLFMDVFKEQFFLSFVKSNYQEFSNWLEAKVAYIQHMKDTDTEYQNLHQQQMTAIKELGIESELKPLLDPKDCSDTAAVLEKLRIIKNNMDTSHKTELSIDFDVHRRQMMDFRKTNPPKPHFRLICLDESSMFPTSDDILALITKCGDKIPLVFAIVGISSVSYIQFRPVEMPVYIANNDID